MYNEFTNTNRESWKYTYKGMELLPNAKKLYDKLLKGEIDARTIMSKLMSDMKISHDSKEVRDAKQAIESYGKQREACAVYVHEFGRNLEREYHLSLGDVVYFDLAPGL